LYTAVPALRPNPNRLRLRRIFSQPLNTPTPYLLRKAARILRGGGVIAYPTEAVWGLGCRPDCPSAVARIMRLKGRAPEKGFILIAAHLDQLKPWLAPLERSLLARVAPTWPGPVTWLLPAAADCPHWLTGRHDTLAVRVTAHPVARAVCLAAGLPLVSTSANPGGLRPARSALGVRRMFADALDLIVPGATGGLARATPIRDARSGRVLRL
jgi:L-threonylcarbamoyladenylate synthase